MFIRENKSHSTGTSFSDFEEEEDLAPHIYIFQLYDQCTHSGFISADLSDKILYLI